MNLLNKQINKTNIFLLNYSRGTEEENNKIKKNKRNKENKHSTGQQQQKIQSTMRAETQKTQASGTQMHEHILERNVHIFYTKTCWGWGG